MTWSRSSSIRSFLSASTSDSDRQTCCAMSWQRERQILSRKQIGCQPFLILTLKDRSIRTWTVQARIIDALSKIRTPQAVAVVVQSLKDTGLSQYVRGFAATAVADLKPEGAVEVLAGTLEDKSQIVRWKSAQALGRLGDKQGASALIRLVKDEDQYVRGAAVKSLQQIKAENAEIALVEALNDDSWLVRLNSRQALAETDERAFEPLIKALKSTNSRIQWQAAWVLGRTKMEEAIEPLIESLADPGPDPATRDHGNPEDCGHHRRDEDAPTGWLEEGQGRNHQPQRSPSCEPRG